MLIYVKVKGYRLKLRQAAEGAWGKAPKNPIKKKNIKK